MNANLEQNAAAVLAQKNWTGLSLRELIDAGRISKTDKKTVREFVRAALGDPPTVDEIRVQSAICAFIIRQA